MKETLMDRPKLTIVGATGFDEIVLHATGLVSELVKKHQLSPKMESLLLERLKQKMELNSEGARLAYVLGRFDEQVERYISFGFHESAGQTAEDFRRCLGVLRAKVEKHFSFPAEYPIIDGEFTLLLVIPPEWGISLGWLMRRLDDLTTRPVEVRDGIIRALTTTTVDECGKPAPKEPYVLLGVNGGRGLRDKHVATARYHVMKHGYTFLSAHQFAELIIVRPQFLSSGESAIVLGEKFVDGHMFFSAQNKGSDKFITLQFLKEVGAYSQNGIGKPYYTKMLTMND